MARRRQRNRQASRNLWLRVKPWGPEEGWCPVGKGMSFAGAGVGCEGSERSWREAERWLA